jgi:hypothetical protein
MTESICLALKTFDINSSDAQAEYYNIIVTTNTGKVFDNRTGYTWNNVNMKNLLGDWYNKYDKFNICLVSVTQSYQSTQPIGVCNVVAVKMSGLQWLSSYDQATGNDTGSVLIGVRNFNQNDDLSNTNCITFRKGQQITNITINLDCLQNDNTLVPNVQSTFGHMIFLFTISPVKD